MIDNDGRKLGYFAIFMKFWQTIIAMAAACLAGGFWQTTAQEITEPEMREACPRESASRIRRGNAPHNLGVIRHVAMNLLKREPTEVSVRKKRIRTALNDIPRQGIDGTMILYSVPLSRRRTTVGD